MGSFDVEPGGPALGADQAIQPDVRVVSPEQQGTPDLQETMKEAMAKLDRKNEELKGHLFSSIGEGDRRFLFFPVPKEEDDDQGYRKADIKFLIATLDGFRILNVFTSRGGETKALVDHLTSRDDLPPPDDENQVGFFEAYDEKTNPNGADERITTHSIKNYKRLFHIYRKVIDVTKSYYLADIDSPDQVQELIGINKGRAEAKLHQEEMENRKAEEKRQQDEQRARTNIQAAQSLDQILG